MMTLKEIEKIFAEGFGLECRCREEEPVWVLVDIVQTLTKEVRKLKTLYDAHAQESCKTRRSGTGEVKKWEAVDPKTKYPTGRYVGMRPCPYCSKARKVMGEGKEKQDGNR